MKTLKNILLATILTLSAFSFTFAKGDEICTKTELVDQLKREVDFPELVSGYGYKGTVEISFEISPEGKINVISTKSNSSMLEIHVKESLEGKRIHPDMKSDCGLYSTTLEFQ